MRHRIVHSFPRLLVLVVMSCFLVCCGAEKPKVYDHQGNELSLQSGRWQLIHYWATWCHACMQEMPDLVALQAKYPEAVQVVGVNFDGLANEELSTLAKDYHVNFPLVSALDYHQWGVDAIETVPTTLVINPEGKLARIERLPRTLSQWQHLLSLDETHTLTGKE